MSALGGDMGSLEKRLLSDFEEMLQIFNTKIKSLLKQQRVKPYFKGKTMDCTRSPID